MRVCRPKARAGTVHICFCGRKAEQLATVINAWLSQPISLSLCPSCVNRISPPNIAWLSNLRRHRAEAPPIIGGKGLRQWQVCQRKAFLNSASMVDRLAQLEKENAQLRKENKLLKQVKKTEGGAKMTPATAREGRAVSALRARVTPPSRSTGLSPCRLPRERASHASRVFAFFPRLPRASYAVPPSRSPSPFALYLSCPPDDRIHLRLRLSRHLFGHTPTDSPLDLQHPPRVLCLVPCRKRHNSEHVAHLSYCTSRSLPASPRLATSGRRLRAPPAQSTHKHTWRAQTHTDDQRPVRPPKYCSPAR